MLAGAIRIIVYMFQWIMHNILRYHTRRSFFYRPRWISKLNWQGNQIEKFQNEWYISLQRQIHISFWSCQHSFSPHKYSCGVEIWVSFTQRRVFKFWNWLINVVVANRRLPKPFQKDYESPNMINIEYLRWTFWA